MLHLVQFGNVGLAQDQKKKAKEWENKLKKNEECLKKLESEKKKKREQYEGELGVVFWNSVNTMLADWDTYTRLGHCKSPYLHTVLADIMIDESAKSNQAWNPRQSKKVALV